MPADPPSPQLDSLAFTLSRYAQNRPALACPADNPAALPAWRDQARARLLDLLGPMPDQPVPLRPRVDPATQRDGYNRYPLTFATRDDLDAFAYLLIPDQLSKPAPALLCLPGHGRGVDDIVGINDDGTTRDHPDGYQHDFAVQAVKRGYVTLALEMLGFGHRRDPAARAQRPRSQLLPARRRRRPDAGPNHGRLAYLGRHARPRPPGRPPRGRPRPHRPGRHLRRRHRRPLHGRARRPREGRPPLRLLLHLQATRSTASAHCIDNYVPGILRHFEMPDLTGLIAPRYLFCESGTADDIFPLDGVKEALQQAAAIYQAAGAPDHLDHAFFEAGHQFDGQAAFARLAEWL